CGEGREEPRAIGHAGRLARGILRVGIECKTIPVRVSDLQALRFGGRGLAKVVTLRFAQRLRGHAFRREVGNLRSAVRCREVRLTSEQSAERDACDPEEFASHESYAMSSVNGRDV